MRCFVCAQGNTWMGGVMVHLDCFHFSVVNVHTVFWVQKAAAGNKLLLSFSTLERHIANYLLLEMGWARREKNIAAAGAH